MALAQRDKVPKRSLPPAKFDEQTEDVFSGDASDRLRGERPAIGAGAAAGAVPVTDASEPSGVTSFAWSGLISASTIVDEIKVHRADLAKNVRNVRVFRSGGNIDTRLRFTVIAAMFGIAAEYDADVRWKRQASAARDAFAAAGRNSKAADDNTFQESRQRSEDLDALIRGESVDLVASEERLTWDRVAERPPLMQRLEKALDDRLRPWTASKREYQRHQQEALHEAEIIAALAEIIQREEYEFIDDDDYLAYCKRLASHAATARTAAREQDFESLERAVGEIAKSCSACHEDYR